jgi:hypothetical protein
LVHSLKPTVNRLKPLVYNFELPVYGLKPTVNRLKPLVYNFELPVYGLKPTVNRLKLPVYGFNKGGKRFWQLQQFPAEQEAPQGFRPLGLFLEYLYQIADVVDGGHLILASDRILHLAASFVS